MTRLKDKVKDFFIEKYSPERLLYKKYDVQTFFGEIESESIMISNPEEYVRIPFLSFNNHVFVYLDYKDKIPKDIREHNNIIYTSAAEPGLRRYFNIPYTICVLGGLHDFDLNNRDIIDFGSGAGILSLYAKKNGVNKIVAIEKEEIGNNGIKSAISANKMNYSDFNLFQKNIIPSWPRKKISSEELNELVSPNSVAVLNMGTTNSYKKPNNEAIRLIKDMPNITALVNGGYSNNIKYGSDEVEDDLISSGFSITNKITNDYMHCAFVAQR